MPNTWSRTKNQPQQECMNSSFFPFIFFFFGFYLISITWTRLWWGRWQPVRSASAAGVWAWVCITILWWVTVSPAVTIGSRPRRVAIWVSRSVGSSIKSRSPVITWWGSGGSRAALCTTIGPAARSSSCTVVMDAKLLCELCKKRGLFLVALPPSFHILILLK